MSLLNLTNYNDHPTNRAYVVFFFSRKEVADTFEELLLINAIDFVRDQEDEGVKRHLFGVLKTEFPKAEKLNYQALGKHRSRFIGNLYVRLAILVITLLMVAIAVTGALMSVKN